MSAALTAQTAWHGLAAACWFTAAVLATGAIASTLLARSRHRWDKRRQVRDRFNDRLAASSRFITEGGRAEVRPGDGPDGRTELDRLSPWQVCHHVLCLDDGHQVGVSVSGAGIPFVLLHGIGFHNRTYEHPLSYLPEFGFLAVAIEAPGHGQSSPAERGADFVTRVDLIRRALDALGLRRAIVAGHSMGGRSAACLVATEPERALAAVFIDAALGESWDMAAIKLLSSHGAIMRGLVGGLVDAAGQTRSIPWPGRMAYYRMLSGPGRPRLADLGRVPDVARSIAVAESDQWLDAIRDAGVPVVVMHGARDLVVPLPDARAVARRLDAPLLTLPDGYHSWLLASPRTFAATMAEIFADPASIAGSADSCFETDALVLKLSPLPARSVAPRADRTLLDWRIERPAWG